MTDIPFEDLYKLQQELLSASLEDGDVEQRAAQAIVAMYERDQANDLEVRRLRSVLDSIRAWRAQFEHLDVHAVQQTGEKPLEELDIILEAVIDD